MISYEKARFIISEVVNRNSTLTFLPQNLIDLIWKDKPSKPLKKVYIQNTDSMADVKSKLSKLRNWIRSQAPEKSRHCNMADIPVATLITSLTCIGMCKVNISYTRL